MKLDANDALVYCHLTAESTVDEIVTKLKPKIDDVEFKREAEAHWELCFNSKYHTEWTFADLHNRIQAAIFECLGKNKPYTEIQLTKDNTLRKGEAALYLRGVE